MPNLNDRISTNAVDSQLLTPRLTKLQWMVIRIGVGESKKFRAHPGLVGLINRLSTFVGMRSDWRACSPLANEGLEALRQFVYLSRQHGEAVSHLYPQLMAAGIDESDISAIASYVQRV